MNLVTNIPLIDVAPIDPRTGKWTEAWFIFFVQLFRRTGGDSGGDGQLTIADILGLEDFLPQADFSSQETARISDAIAQVRATVAAWDGALVDPGTWSPNVSDAAAFPIETVAPWPISSSAPDVLVTAPVSDSAWTQAPSAITVGASPFSYKATSRQAVHLTGGTVSSLSYVRGSSTLTLSVASGGQLVEMNAGDALTVTYSDAPTMTVIPR